MTDEPLDLDRLDRRHQPVRNFGVLSCRGCSQDWPCDLARLLGRVRELEAKNEQER